MFRATGPCSAFTRHGITITVAPATSAEANVRQIITAISPEGLSSFETELVNIEKSTITNSTQIIQFMLEVVPTAEPEPWLKKQQVTIEEKPTVAGLVLFAEEPQAALPKRCGLKI